MTPEGTIPGNGKKLRLDFEDTLEFEGNMGSMMQQLELG